MALYQNLDSAIRWKLKLSNQADPVAAENWKKLSHDPQRRHWPTTIVDESIGSLTQSALRLTVRQDSPRDEYEAILQGLGKALKQIMAASHLNYRSVEDSAATARRAMVDAMRAELGMTQSGEFSQRMLESFRESFVKWYQQNQMICAPRLAGEMNRVVDELRQKQKLKSSPQQTPAHARRPANPATPVNIRTHSPSLPPNPQRPPKPLFPNLPGYPTPLPPPPAVLPRAATTRQPQKIYPAPVVTPAPLPAAMPPATPSTPPYAPPPPAPAPSMLTPVAHAAPPTPPIPVTTETLDDQPAAPAPAPAPVAAPPVAPTPAGWRCLPINDDPDPHDPYDARRGVSPDGLTIIGGRARGKKHKHEGTNCDDWFDFLAVGPWTLMAVSDGAGSYRFSRRGARRSCEVALESLSRTLADHRYADGDENDLQRHPETRCFAGSDLEHVQRGLQQAVNDAYEAVVKMAADHREDEAYRKVLGRPPEIKDFSATLLLAVHGRRRIGEREHDVVIACQVGDGMIAAVGGSAPPWKLQLMAKPDTGAYAGETEFLTSQELLTEEKLRARTEVFVGSLRALMLMTDGVADDYFPNDPGMLYVLGDMVLNGVVDLKGLTPAALDEALAATKAGPTAESPILSSLGAETVRLVSECQTQPVNIRTITGYAEALQEPPEVVLNSPALLVAGRAAQPLSPAALSAEQRLMIWLDSYQVRGSFDDRTLLVLCQETL